MTGFFHAIRTVYRDSRKKEDIAWNTYVARPMAAVLVHLLRATPLTPNQVTFLGGIVFAVAALVMVLASSPLGFLGAALLIHFSYLLDCADGQLARLKQMTSEVGAHLDFLMDEIKALMLVAAAAIRLWVLDDEVLWLFVAIAAIFLVAVATSLTNFVRRPEYAGQTIAPGESARKKAIPSSPIGKAIWLAEAIARYFVHYPSWILWVALIGLFAPLDPAIFFLLPFLGVYLLYLARTGLAIVLKLGTPGFYRS